MPFTIAHPAIILPLCRNKKLSVTALFVGSMVPDFEFFFQLREVENIGHHWYGILLFDMPIALLLTYIFHRLLRDVLIEHMPHFLKSRFIQYKYIDWSGYVRQYPLTIVFSLLIGIFSHIVWDGFTHHDGFFVSRISFLLHKTGWTFLDIPIYFLLQLVFSVVGLVTVLYMIWRLPQYPYVSRNSNKSYYWETLMFVITSLLLIRMIGWPQYNSFGGLMIAFMGCSFYGWVLVSLLFHYILKYQKYEY